MVLPQPPKLVVIGNFDGVHLGHVAVLAVALQQARARHLVPTLLTFDPHPAVILGRAPPSLLTTLERRRELVAELFPEIDFSVEPFTPELAVLTPEQFASEILASKLGARFVLVGENFRFGKSRAGDLSVLIELGVRLGFEAEAVDLSGDAEGPYSSSRIRHALGRGLVEEASRLLGRPHRLKGRVVHGDERGRLLGFPTANLEQILEAQPGDGVYSVEVRLPNGAVVHGVANVGGRPTVGRPPSVEVHLLDFEGDLYGLELEVDFLERLREVRRFDSVEALISQIGEDAAEARRRFVLA